MQEELKKIIEETERVISGKTEVIKKILEAMLAGGHILLDDVPGVGKTTLAVALSKTMGLKYNRVQFTPDVLPSDIIGFSMYNRETGGFDYKEGVVTRTNILLGDEINRTSSKTQSALLEAMEEKQVTVDGKTYALQSPFIVIATQNNVGTSGTQLLPYAQMDRFLVRLSIGYPDYDSLMELLRNRQYENPMNDVRNVVTLERFLNMQNEVKKVETKDCILDYISRLTIASREHEDLEIGISPRGALYITMMAKAKAYVENRDYVVLDDVQSIFPDVCTHRIIVNQNGRMAGIRPENVVKELLEKVETPETEVLNNDKK